MTAQDKRFMQQAIDLSTENVSNGGGPFGAVIVREGQVVATGVNRVTAEGDPTAHAEVSAIRNACRRDGSFRLEGCTIYSSCEPCPMCLGAIYWAGISRICFAATRHDAECAHFGDKFIYEEIARPIPERTIPTENFMREEAQLAFQAWDAKADKECY